MRLDWEITGEAKGVAYNNAGNAVFTVELFLNDSSVGFLNMNLETEKVDNSLDFESSMIFDFFDIAENFRGYKAFLGLLGIEVPTLALAHWTPEKYSKVYVIVGNEIIEQVSGDRAEIKKACLNYNVFPGLELAERAINLSKLDRLILLWQYKNDCLFIPDWLDGIQYKYYIIYDSRDKNACYDYSFRQKSNNIHFETSEQVKAFVKVYDKEIKKIMGVI